MSKWYTVACEECQADIFARDDWSHIHRLEDLGVTDVIVGFRNPYYEPVDSQTLEQKLELLRGYADNVIAKA